MLEQLYYCRLCANVWYLGEDNRPKFYANIKDKELTDQEFDSCTHEFCDCMESDGFDWVMPNNQ